jgi:hypothetical protein
MADAVEWLIGGEPFVEYRTRIDLLGQPESAPEVIDAKRRLGTDQKIQLLLQELQGWPGQVLNSHKSAGNSYHKLTFIADIGLTKDNPVVSTISAKVMVHQSEEGPFQLPTKISEHYGGSGNEICAWALCDAPILVYCLAKLGYAQEPKVQKAANFLIDLAHDNGYPCTVSKTLGNFRGPGRKDDPCPYATLVMLKMMTQFDNWRKSEEAHRGAECLLNLWQNSKTLHPYIFYMGTDFRKLKAPLVWYDILHVFDVLSQFEWLKSDPRLEDMANVVRSKADAEGKFTAESEWQAWRGWEFAQKKQPSRWLTFLAMRALRRTA